MGESFAAVNPDKGQYLDSNSLGMATKLDGLLATPLPAILTWLMADGAPISGGSAMRGSWAGDRIVVAGDEGSSASLWEKAHRDYRDITVGAFEALASECSSIALTYQDAGVLDDDNRFVPGWAAALTGSDRPSDPTLAPDRRSPLHSDPSVMGGTLVFRASRVPAQTLLDYLDDRYSLDEFLEMFPSVDRGDAEEFLRLARGDTDSDRP
jgi:uncharacterized protein (DUF433 family)